jgi:transcriptional regulator with XRE-family HTH domain
MAKFHPVDVHVGAKMRQQRTLLGMSQEKLGTAVGLTFQQIQKYERGSNRIGSSRLFEFSKVLNVPVEYFFDDVPAGSDFRLKGKRAPTDKKIDLEADRWVVEVAKDLKQIPNKSVRDSIAKHIKAVAKSFPGYNGQRKASAQTASSTRSRHARGRKAGKSQARAHRPHGSSGHDRLQHDQRQ